MMPVKFKIGFTIDAETLFSIVAKFLPLENLSVEEVVAHRAPTAPRLPKAVDTPKIKRRRASKSANGGQLKVIADHVRVNGASSYAEIGNALAAAGFSKSGAGSAISRAIANGLLRKDGSNYALSPADG
jgi:hypothetical protein